ncbi:MAG: hypothetical protein H6842_10270 [Rhodospirillaceae bacterium]|nr:hypothetical protein [Rhodospirillaceae bacterium]
MGVAAIYFIFSFCALLLAILIVSNAMYPKNRYVKSVRDWQTLIGAIVGFAAVSAAILLQGKLSDDREFSRRIDNEMALLQSALTDVDRVIDWIENWMQDYNGERGGLGSMQNCIAFIHLVQNRPIRPISIAGRLDVIGGEVSAYTYAALSESVDIFNLYVSAVQSVGPQDCVTDGESVVDFYFEMAEHARSDLAASKERMATLVVSLSRLGR